MFQQLTNNTYALLASLGIEQAILIDHPTGDMLTTRYTLMYPNVVSRLMMINPIGLEDWETKDVLSMTVDQWFTCERQITVERICTYGQSTYYVKQ